MAYQAGPPPCLTRDPAQPQHLAAWLREAMLAADKLAEMLQNPNYPRESLSMRLAAHSLAITMVFVTEACHTQRVSCLLALQQLQYQSPYGHNNARLRELMTPYMCVIPAAAQHMRAAQAEFYADYTSLMRVSSRLN